MVQPSQRARGLGLGRRSIVLMSVLTLTAAGVGLTVFALRSPVSPKWDEIQRAASVGNWVEADEKLARWILVHPADNRARMMLAKVRLRLGRRDRVPEVLEAIPERSPLWMEAQTTLGELAIAARRAAQAESIFRRAAEHDTVALLPRQRLLYLFSLQQRTAEARKMLWEIYIIRDDPRILVDLVLELVMDQPDVRGLAPELAEFVASTPDDPFLRRAWGMQLLFQGRPADALAHLEAAARSLVNDPVGRFHLAECRILQGVPIQIDDVCGPIPTRPDDAAQWWIRKGRIEESSGLLDRAVASFGQAVAMQNNSREAHYRLGQLFKRMARPQAAKIELELAEDIDKRVKAVRREHQSVRKGGLTQDAEVFEHLAQLCSDAGMIKESRAWLEQSIKLNPSATEAQAKLSKLDGVPDSEPFELEYPQLAAKLAGLSRPTSSPNPEGRPNQQIAAPPFADGAAAAGVPYQYNCGMSDRIFIADTLGGGVGLFDYDNDGWLDIYFVNGCALPVDVQSMPRPNRLYRNQRDGTFRDVTAEAGVGGKGYGMGCTIGDYDNDGDDDLLVTGLHQTILYRNRGDGRFEDVTTSAGVATDRWTTAAGFGDLDGDGDLDLVVVTYVAVQQDARLVCRDFAGRPIHCTPGRYRAEADLLFRNNGNGTFSEVSESAGFRGPDGRGLGLAIADFDADDKLDIFVANDASRNFLFRNLGGFRFEEIGEVAGVAVNGSGRATASMGVVADDLDGDGRIDLLVTNLVNESSTFFQNVGGGLFVDAGLGSGLGAPTRPKTGFGVAALDADRDGRLDLFMANGHVDDRPWANSKMAQSALFFWGLDRGRFAVPLPIDSSYFAHAVVGRGVAAGDLNNDGRVDLVVVHRDRPAALLYNSASENHWIGLKIRGSRSGKTPIGARITVQAGGKAIVRWMTSGTGYLSAHDSRIWIGLGPAVDAKSLEIKWPSGKIQSWQNLKADRLLEIDESRDEIQELTAR